MITGTSWFPSMYCARRYYAYEHHESLAPRAAIERKIAEGLIHIGQPNIDASKQKLVLLDEGNRWGIEDLPTPRPNPNNGWESPEEHLKTIRSLLNGI